MDGKKRLEGQDLADSIADGEPMGPLSYLEHVQFKLNEGRVRLRRAYVQAIAMSVVMGGGEVSKEWADAVSSCPEEAREIWAEWQRIRSEHKLKARLGW